MAATVRFHVPRTVSLTVTDTLPSAELVSPDTGTIRVPLNVTNVQPYRATRRRRNVLVPVTMDSGGDHVTSSVCSQDVRVAIV